MVNPNINSFAMTAYQGQVDLQYHGSVITAQVDSTQTGTLVAGQAVKLTTTAGGVPKVVGCTANDDPVWGFVTRNLKDASYAANAMLEIGLPGTVIYMTATGAITRDAKVIIDATDVEVAPADGVTPTIGYALDTAVNTGDIIRVFTEKNSAAGGDSRTYNGVVTLAQINAGLVLIPGITGQKITVTSYVARVVGAFTTGTSVELESTNASPVAVTTLAEAGLTNGALLLPSSANTTLGAGFAVPLGSGDGLQVVNNGSAQAGGTSIQFTITFQQA